MGKNTFADFLKYTPSQREVSLAIAKDESELKEFIEILESQEYRQAIDTSELFKNIESPSKVFFIVRDKLPKDIYDFIVQYSTGQIEIFDRESMQSKNVIPAYEGISIVFLITKQALRHVQEAGFQILDSVGITYQS